MTGAAGRVVYGLAAAIHVAGCQKPTSSEPAARSSASATADSEPPASTPLVCPPASSGPLATPRNAWTYPVTYPSASTEDRRARESMFRDRNPGVWSSVTLDGAGYLVSLATRDACLVPRAPNEEGGAAAVAHITGLIVRNGDLFGVADPKSLRWAVGSPRPGVAVDVAAHQIVGAQSIATIRAQYTSGAGSAPELIVTGHFWPGAAVPEVSAKAREAAASWKRGIIGTKCEAELSGARMPCDPVVGADGIGRGCEKPVFGPPIRAEVTLGDEVSVNESVEWVDGPAGRSLRLTLDLRAGSCRSLHARLDGVTAARVAP